MTTTPVLQDAVLTTKDGVAVLTLNRDDVRNELTGTRLTDEIVAVAEWVNGADHVSVLILTGAGKAFSAGGNVHHMRDRAGIFGGDVYEVQENYRRGIQRIATAIDAVEVPVIAAVNGSAIGAGFDLTNMCDIRIAAESAKLGSTFLNLGIIPGDGGAWFLQRLVGAQRAAELIFTGRVFGAVEAKEMGLVLEVVPKPELMVRAMELARMIASKPAQATRMTKRLLAAAPRTELRDFLNLCSVYQGMCHNSADHMEAIEAFIGKREPVYKRNLNDNLVT